MASVKIKIATVETARPPQAGEKKKNPEKKSYKKIRAADLTAM